MPSTAFTLKDVIFSAISSFLVVIFAFFIGLLVNPSIMAIPAFFDGLLKIIDFLAYLLKQGLAQLVNVPGMEIIIDTFIPGGATTVLPEAFPNILVDFLVVFTITIGIIFGIEYTLMLRSRDALGLFITLNITLAVRGYQKELFIGDTLVFLIFQVTWLELTLILTYYHELHVIQKRYKKSLAGQKKILEYVRERERPESLRRLEPLISTYFSEFHDRLMSGSNPFADLNRLNNYLGNLKSRLPFAYNSLTPLFYKSLKKEMLSLLEIAIRIAAVVFLVVFLYQGVLGIYRASLPSIYDRSVELAQPEIFLIPLFFVIFWLLIITKIVGWITRKPKNKTS